METNLSDEVISVCRVLGDLSQRLKEHQNIADMGSNRTREKYRARADELAYVIGQIRKAIRVPNNTTKQDMGD